jgi:23S rRNA (adenine2503-C2)-methyltransferase
MSTKEKRDIRALSQQELRDFFVEKGEQPFRGNQVFEWLWQKGAHHFDDMTNLSLALRTLLEEHFSINHIAISRMQKSVDGTIKNAVSLHDDMIVESVLIPTAKRTTACVSSQVGCSLNCEFCATAKLKRMRNLNPDEIFDQVVAIDQQSQEYFGRKLSNIVFMGMGEPLMNYNNVIKAIDKITAEKGLQMSPKRITLSTSGIPKMIKKMANDGVKFNLALSLHSAIQEVREKIMPFCSKFPLEDLLESLQYWHEKTGRITTLEYLIWKGINDREEDRKALVDFAKKVPCKVNIITYNSIDEDQFVQAGPVAVKAYVEILEKNRIPVTIRRSRGDDIDAACGQLANKS